MSEFNKTLDQAKAKQRLLHMALTAVIVLGGLIVGGVFVVSNGTRIEVQPIEAKEIAKIEMVSGLGVSVGGTIYSIWGSPSISVQAKGFKSAIETIPASHIGSIHPITLFELPGRLLVQTSTANDQTKWIIDGRSAAISKELDVSLKAGQYKLVIDDPYSELLETSVDIKRDEETRLSVELSPLQGNIDIVSEPSGAHVAFDGFDVGETPLFLVNRAKKYAIKLSLDNYKDVNDEIEIKRGAQSIKRSYKLELQKASILVHAEPAQGTLLLDGVKVSLGTEIEAGVLKDHTISYMKDGYFTQKQVFALQKGEQKEISFKLTPEIGQVDIQSSPTASVFIDGVEKGETPISITLLAVSHKIEVKKDGYRSFFKTVKPSAKEKQMVSAQLLPEGVVRLQEAPKNYTNSVGGRLKLYQPNESLTLGAQRSEKGQRANEFLRKVALNKPFYAGLYEVTNAEFKAFNAQKANGAAKEPVTSVSWMEAALYCNWLSAKEKLTPFYEISGNRLTGFNPQNSGYRLLSEAEWEWLARKAFKKTQTIFTWGDETVIPPNAANIADESANGSVQFYVPNYSDKHVKVATVGSYTTEKSGLYDQAGNVSEWVHDVYSITPPVSNSVEENPLGAQSGITHVVKGANWRSGTITTLRPAFREGLVEGRDDLGFRIGRYLGGQGS
jgi:formylglycine-generating enzyme required for sulfatase activity